jgi:hypothetical protein
MKINCAFVPSPSFQSAFDSADDEGRCELPPRLQLFSSDTFVTAPPKAIALQVDWRTQMGAGDNCFETSVAMAKDAGATVLDRSKVIQIDEPKKITQGRAYIDAELQAGRPVVVGVDHSPGAHNPDGVTDHYVLITGRTADGAYTFNDPGTRHPEWGSDWRPQNRFEIDAASGNLVRPAVEGADPQKAINKRYVLTIVRKNAESN